MVKKKTARQRRTRSQRILQRVMERREEFWPDIPDRTWNRTNSDGFTTIPRTLALIGTIADMLAGKSKRVSTVYWGLWCRVWDTAGLVTIENEYELATEAGFSGERRIYTWRDRIKLLIKLKFIEVRPGPKGPYQYVLIFNPYHVLYDHHESGKIQDQYWLSFTERAEEIGAKDIDKYTQNKNLGGENAKTKKRPLVKIGRL